MFMRGIPLILVLVLLLASAIPLAPVAGPAQQAPLRGRSGPVVSDLIGSEQKDKAPEDVAHPGRSQDADSVMESRPINGPELRDVHDAGPRKSCFTLP